MPTHLTAFGRTPTGSTKSGLMPYIFKMHEPCGGETT